MLGSKIVMKVLWKFWCGKLPPSSDISNSWGVGCFDKKTIFIKIGFARTVLWVIDCLTYLHEDIQILRTRVCSSLYFVKSSLQTWIWEKQFYYLRHSFYAFFLNLQGFPEYSISDIGCLIRNKCGHINGYFIFLLIRGSVVVEALCYKPDGRGFDFRWGEFLNLPNPSCRTRPWGLLSL
jgi:hypothetical protein